MLVAGKYGFPKNTLSSWVRNKDKLLDSLEKGSDITRQKLTIGNFEMVDKAIFNRLLSMCSQNVPLAVAMIQEKALTFAKELNVENFQTLDGWLRLWKGRSHKTFKTVSREPKTVTPEMADGWLETFLPNLL